MSAPYIAAYKAGATDVTPYITKDELVYWYRPTPRALDCDATDTTMADANNASGNYFKGRPNGWESMSDSVFVVSLLTSPGQVSVTSGSTSQTFDAPAGAAAWSVPMGVGAQKFSLARNGLVVLSGTSLRDVANVCPCGLYNFNAYVGTLTCSGGGAADALGGDGLASLTAGLKVTTCAPKPSLGTPVAGSCGAAPTSSGAQVTPSSASASVPVQTKTSSTSAPVQTTTFTTATATPSATPSASKACGRTITASAQIFPTNCLQPGDVWAGPSGQGKPDRCDGAAACTA